MNARQATTFVLAVFIMLPAAVAHGQTVQIGGDLPAPLEVAENADGSVLGTAESDHMHATFPATSAGTLSFVRPGGDTTLSVQQSDLAVFDSGGEMAQSFGRMNGNPSVDGAYVHYDNVFPQADDRYRVHDEMVKYDLVLHEQPAFAVQAGSVGTKSVLQYSGDLTVEFGDATTTASGAVLTDTVKFVDASGEVQFRLGNVFAMDAAAGSVDGQYRIVEQREGSITVVAEVSLEWMSQAQYPVVLDPTIFVGANFTTTSVVPFDFFFPPGTSVPSRTFMQHIPDAQLPATGYITAIGFTPFGTSGLFFADARITIGESTFTTGTPPDPTFDDNFTGPTVVALEGQMDLEAPTFEYTMIELTDFFEYTGGSLGIKIEMFEPPTGGGTSYIVDDQNVAPPPLGGWRQWNDDANSATESGSSDLLNYMQIEFRDFHIEDSSIPAANADVGSYSHTFSVQPSTATGTWSATGLPPNFGIDSSSGELSASTIDPQDADDYEIEVTFESGGEDHTRTYTLTVFAGVVQIEETVMPAATEGFSYDRFIETSGGSENFEFTLTGGDLPPGLTLESDGRVTGTVPFGTEGTFSFNVEVEDLDFSDTDTGNMSLEVRSIPEIEVSDMIAEILQNGDSWGPQPIVIVGGVEPFEVAVTFSEEAEDAGLEFDDEAGLHGEIFANEITGIGAGDEVEVRIIARDVNNALTVATVILRGPAPLEAGDGSGGGCGALPNSAFGKLVALALLIAFVGLARRRIA